MDQLAQGVRNFEDFLNDGNYIAFISVYPAVGKTTYPLRPKTFPFPFHKARTPSTRLWIRRKVSRKVRFLSAPSLHHLLNSKLENN